MRGDDSVLRLSSGFGLWHALGLLSVGVVVGSVAALNWMWWPAYLDFDHVRIRQGFEINFTVFPSVLGGLAILYLGIGALRSTGRVGFCALGLLCAFGAVSIGVLRWYVSVFEHTRLEVREVELLTPKLKEPITILHISDLEAVAIGVHERRALEKVSSLPADMVLFTGDWFEPPRGESARVLWDEALPYLNKIQPRLGFWGVYGDSDSGLYRIPVSEESPLTMLDFRERRIDLGDGTAIELKGLSLYQSRISGVADRHVSAWLKKLEPGVFSILLGHGPSFITDAVHSDVDLCLAGHTHGGQVRLPFFGPLVYNSDIPAEWALGFHQVKGTAFNVSAGLGSDRFGDLPIIRFNCSTEMTLIHLVPERPPRK